MSSIYKESLGAEKTELGWACLEPPKNKIWNLVASALKNLYVTAQK